MAKSKLPRSAPRSVHAAPLPKLPDAALNQNTATQAARDAKLSMPGASTPPRSVSPTSHHDADSNSLSASAKKKKKKSKARAKESDYVDDHDFDLQAPNLAQRPRSPTSLAARAQAQAQLLAAASELYRRIEGDPQGIPDDDAYWTSLPAHLRTFIRNALPLGQFPPATQAALDGNPNDPKNRHDSTKAMIAVAQQLAQAAHASQRHLQQYPSSGNHAYPPLPFDPSIFADLALHPDQPMPLLSHPNSLHPTTNGSYPHYASSPNPPPTQPPVEPLPPPVVLYNNFDDEDVDRYDDRDDGDEYCSYDELEADGALHDAHGNLLRDRNGLWVQDDSDHIRGPNGMTAGMTAISDAMRTSSKSSKKKKKKKKSANAQQPEDDLPEPEAPVPPKPVASHPAPATNVSSVNRSSNPPPPSSRAAGKQPMTFNSNGKTPARPVNGAAVPSNSGKRSVSSSTHGHLNPTVNNAKIWSTSSAEERERIKEFWLGLSMKDRQKLVQVEKETVLKKMKEQQRHLCSCAVCGRKRSAIEDELEVLYDAYYDELEDYANHQQRWVISGGTIPPPPGPGPFPGSVALDSSGAVIGGDPLSKARAPIKDTRHTHNHHHHHHHHGQQRGALHPESSDGYDDEELDDDADYDDDEDDDVDYDDDEEEEELELERERAREDYHKRAPVVPAAGRRRGPGADDDLFGLGNSLTVKGGILTVADDMLKNDGRKFLEMMEQLAERRMHREELTGAELALADDDDDEDHPDDLDDEDDIDDEDEDDEDNILTDEQRMEEGRKMFQIFAARMFEQRVLQAYRERVAQERQLQLLRELEEEDSNEKAREARRQKEAQKKKDKKKAQKEAKDAEKSRKDQEKAAADAEARAQLQAARDLELRKQEELRSKKDAERKAKEEEKAKKDEEKRRRLAEERDRELERERKRKEKEEKARLEREAQEQAKRNKEDEARKAKEEQERVQREKAEKEAKAKEEQDRKLDALRKEKEAKAQAQRDAKQAASNAGRATPVSPAGTRSTASKSPAASHASVRSAKTSTSIPSSPAVPPSASRAATSNSGSRGGTSQKFAPSSVPTSAPALQSTLPAPPQGLPPRPTTSVLTPNGGAVSQGSSVSVAANAGLPRPPVSSGVSTSMSFSSIGAPSVPSVPTSTSATPSVFDQGPVVPGVVGHHLAAPGPRSGESYTTQPGLEGLRSPNMANGFVSGSVGDSGVHTPTAPPGMSGMASSLASLNLGAGSMPPGMGMGSVQHAAGPSFGSDPLRSRTTSFVDTDPMAAFGGMRPGSAATQRSTYRPSQPPAPIGPIGRPKAVEAFHQEEQTFGNGRSSSNTSGSGATSPRLPEGILGSSALGGDDDIIQPKPRRTSHTIPIGGGATGSNVGAPGAFYNGSGSVGAGAAGFGMVSTPSPWSSFSGSGAGGPQSAQGPLSPGFNNVQGPGAIGSASFAPSGPGGATGQPDLWSRGPSSWDRARFAFEQPGGGLQQHMSGPATHQMGMAPPGQLSSNAFGMTAPSPPGPRNLFGAPGSGASHPAPIGALSPTSRILGKHD